MRIFFLTLLRPIRRVAIGLALTLPVSAYAQSTHLTHYRASQAAQAAGETAKAITEAEAAWKAAEDNLGDNKLTGILAYNYGSMLVQSSPKESVTPLKRAKALAKKEGSDLPLDVLDAYLAYGAYTKLPGQKTAVSLREALSPLLVKGGIPQIDDAFMWLILAQTEAAQSRLWNAEPAAQMVIKALESAGLEDAGGPALNSALIIRASAGLSGRDRTVGRQSWALDDLERVIETFKPQSSRSALDPVLAAALAWKAVALNALGSDTNAALNDAQPLEAAFSTYAGSPSECGAVWEKRPEAKFSASEYYPQGLYPGYAGATLIGYDISKTGKIENTEVLANAPNGETTRAAKKAFKKWKLKTTARQTTRDAERTKLRPLSIPPNGTRSRALEISDY